MEAFQPTHQADRRKDYSALLAGFGSQMHEEQFARPGYKSAALSAPMERAPQ